MKPFLGTVLDVRLRELPLPPGPVTNMSTVRAQLSNSDTIRITMKILSGPVTDDTVRLLKINVGRSVVPYLDVLQHGRSLWGYQKLGLSWVGLRVPWLVLEEVMPGVAGDTVLISLEASRQRLRFAAAHSGVSREAVLRLSPDLYLSALFSRASDDMLWWRFVPTSPYFALLGLALASRPKLFWRVHRPALVVGDSRTGEMDKIDGPYYFFKLIQKLRKMLPSWMPTIGIEGGRINVVPVDFIVNAVDHIAHLKGEDGKCFHLVTRPRCASVTCSIPLPVPRMRPRCRCGSMLRCSVSSRTVCARA